MNEVTSVILVLVIAFSCSSFAWEIHDHYEDKNGYILQMRGESIAALGEVVASEKRQLHSLDMGRLVQLEPDTIQTDIMSYLSKNYPQELKEALNSAGNMHNPKMIALRKPFEEALLNTLYVKTINEILEPHDYKIAGVSFEKLFLIKEEDSILFDALTWFKIGQLTNKGTGRSAPVL